jgi:hypothetical protein
VTHNTWKKIVARTKLKIGLDESYLFLLFFGIRIAYYALSWDTIAKESGIWLCWIPWNLPEGSAAPAWSLRHRHSRKQEAFIA